MLRQNVGGGFDQAEFDRQRSMGAEMRVLVRRIDRSSSTQRRGHVVHAEAA